MNNQDIHISLVQWTLAIILALPACYDEVIPPECFEPSQAFPNRTAQEVKDHFEQIYQELEEVCIATGTDQANNLAQCEQLWFGKIDDSQRGSYYRSDLRLLTLQSIPVEGSTLYARCLPKCTSENCECESDLDCTQNERCLGPRLKAKLGQVSQAQAFCLPKCSNTQDSNCKAIEGSESKYYCASEQCYYSDEAMAGEMAGEMAGVMAGEMAGEMAGIIGGVDPEPDPIYEPQTAITNEEYDPLALVDPMIATGGAYSMVSSVTPAASAPNGLSMIGPDTRVETGMFPAYHCAGYHYSDTHIQGFSHTHAHGMGVVDYGGISVMPRGFWDPAYQSFEGRAAPFNHNQEYASPGNYRVTLADDATRVELVATEHGAHHRYTFIPSFDPSQDHVVIIDLGDHLVNTQTISAQIEATDAEVRVIQVLDGAYSGRFGGAIHHAVLRFNPAPSAYQVWVDDGELMDGGNVSGRTAGLVARFPSTLDVVELTVGLSFVDLDGAKRNLEAELPDFDIEARRAEVKELWKNALSTVKVRSKNEEDLKRFATAHYHSLLMPSLHSDVDGRYRGLDQEIHQLPAGERYYSDLSLWDTFRTLHSFYLLAHPKLQRDILTSLIRMYQDGGSLPRWPLAHGYTGGMIGTPATQLFAEALLKGLEGWDAQIAYQAALAQSDLLATQATRSGGASYNRLGWVPADEQSGSVSKTLEYAWSDASLTQMARTLNQSADIERLDLRAQSWKNLWNPQASESEGGFMVARNEDGSFVPFNAPELWEDGYTEGNAWHYLWYVPYAISTMIEVQHGGDTEAFLSRLSGYWEQVRLEEDDNFPDDYYWHGNEPVLHYAWLGSLAGDLALTVQASHHILQTRYGHTPQDGLDGNDDSGTLSAWYLFASLGLYPIAGTDQYALGAPIFERAEFNPHEGTAWVIEAPHADWNQVPNQVFQLPNSNVTQANQNHLESHLTTISHEKVINGLWFHRNVYE